MSTESENNNPVAPDHQLVIAEMQQQLARYEKAFDAMSSSPGVEEDDAIDLREYWNVIVRRRWTVFITLGLLLLCTLLATVMMTPVYRATTVVQIERESGKVLEYQNLTAEEAVNAKDFYETQYELLKSRTLARRVIDQLGLNETSSTPADESGGFFAAIQGALNTVLGDSDVESEEQPADLETLFLRNLDVEPVRKSRLVRLHYDSPEPQEAATVVNTLAAGFVEMSLERRFEASTYAKGFLEERILEVREDLESSEQALVEYTQERGIINQDDKLGILTEKLKEMNRELVQVQAQMYAAESQYQEMLGSSSGSLAQMLDSAVVQDLKRSRTALTTEYQELLKVFKPAYPKMRRIQEKIDRIDLEMAAEVGNIQDGIQVEYQAKLREEAKLQQSITATRKEILDLQFRSTDFQTLKREVDTNRELYDGLLQRMKEVGVSAGVSNNNIFVVDKAQVPRRPYKPNLLLNLAGAVFAGLFLGVVLAFAFEAMDDTVNSSADLEELIKKPVLGIIPRPAQGSEFLVEDTALASFHDPTCAIAEAYRSMRTALMFATSDGAPRVIHFTSVNASEGKTTCAVNTAINFTQTGGKVLLIDADLRDPSLHKVFGRPNEKGLSSYLSGHARPAEVTQASGVKGLFVMTSGPVPPHPAELLQGARMLDLVKLAEKRFDYVVIDSPPLVGLADSLILADLAKATLMVAAAGKTRRGGIEAGMKRLSQSRANLLGSVLTGFDLRRSSYGYGYDYNYDYTYGGTERAKDNA